MTDEHEEQVEPPIPDIEQQVILSDLTLEQALVNWENAVGGFGGNRAQWKVLEASIAMVKEAALRTQMNRQQRRAKR